MHSIGDSRGDTRGAEQRELETGARKRQLGKDVAREREIDKGT